jgi:hypothetical protein
MMVFHGTKFLFRFVAIVLFPVIAIAQNEPKAAHLDAKREWGKAVEGQALSIATEKTVYAPGERVVLNVAFKNVGQKIVFIGVDYFFNSNSVKVMFADGKDVPLTSYGKLYAKRKGGSGFTFDAKPGEYLHIEIELNRMFDMTLAGKYRISVQRNITRENKELEEKATSNEIEIEINESLNKVRFYQEKGDDTNGQKSEDAQHKGVRTSPVRHDDCLPPTVSDGGIWERCDCPAS